MMHTDEVARKSYFKGAKEKTLARAMSTFRQQMGCPPQRQTVRRASCATVAEIAASAAAIGSTSAQQPLAPTHELRTNSSPTGTDGKPGVSRFIRKRRKRKKPRELPTRARTMMNDDEERHFLGAIERSVAGKPGRRIDWKSVRAQVQPYLHTNFTETQLREKYKRMKLGLPSSSVSPNYVKLRSVVCLTHRSSGGDTAASQQHVRAASASTISDKVEQNSMGVFEFDNDGDNDMTSVEPCDDVSVTICDGAATGTDVTSLIKGCCPAESLERQLLAVQQSAAQRAAELAMRVFLMSDENDDVTQGMDVSSSLEERDDDGCHDHDAADEIAITSTKQEIGNFGVTVCDDIGKEDSEELDRVRRQPAREVAAQTKALEVMAVQKSAAQRVAELEEVKLEKLTQNAMDVFEFDDELDGSKSCDVDGIAVIKPACRTEGLPVDATTPETDLSRQSRCFGADRSSRKLLNSAVPRAGTKVKASFTTGSSEGTVTYREGSKVWVSYPEMVDRPSIGYPAKWFHRNLQVLVKPGDPKRYRLPPALLRRAAVSGGLLETGITTGAYDATVWHEPIDWAGDKSEVEAVLGEPVVKMRRSSPNLASSFEARTTSLPSTPHKRRKSEASVSHETDLCALDLERAEDYAQEAVATACTGKSEYEMERERRIQRNLEMQRLLGLHDAKISLDNACRHKSDASAGKRIMQNRNCRTTTRRKVDTRERHSLRQARAHPLHESDDARHAHQRVQHQTRRRQYTRWTHDEVRALKEGVKIFGRGKWQKILGWGGIEFHNRSAVDLKDKWRTLNR
eukprot:COSAG02_NODE_911_length_16005_cov_9.262983_6_plen_798_part_00